MTRGRSKAGGLPARRIREERGAAGGRMPFRKPNPKLAAKRRKVIRKVTKGKKTYRA